MKPVVGQSLWLLLHEWAGNIPLNPSDSEQLQAILFFSSWAYTIVPAFSDHCDCAQWLEDYIKKNPPPFASGREAMTKWASALHNAVNRKLGKADFTLGAPVTGRWAQLHTYAWRYPSEPTARRQQEARAWYATWRSKHFCGSCGLQLDWLPRTLSDEILTLPRNFYWWSVAAHDRWNYIHGKPLHAPDWSSQHPLFANLPLRNFLKT